MAIVEDNKDELKIMIDELNQCSKELGVKFELSFFESAEALLFYVSENPNQFEIIYLDIMLKSKSGVEAATELRNKGSRSILIFVTSSEEFLLDAFDVQALNYLIKHKFTHEKFKSVLEKAISQIESEQKKVFVCEYKGNKYVIPLHKIMYFEVFNKLVTVHYGNEEISFYSNLNETVEKLDPTYFIQVHRSFIVNLNFITSVYKNTIKLKSGIEIPIGKTYMDFFEAAFVKYMSKHDMSKIKEEIK
ncbi:LytR/AlgR family response regulator transcription factor [Acholeplasma hippikon]|uniref:LytR/AlgR family response regulator transcription factor n=1 Tax=Acholeplasma hippikon TaxID=264636 RepID=UPI00138E0425|nr:LytTR family DNA-binding domain-containing protein [Acholeplasma hippikon]